LANPHTDGTTKQKMDQTLQAPNKDLLASLQTCHINFCKVPTNGCTYHENFDLSQQTSSQDNFSPSQSYHDLFSNYQNLQSLPQA